METLAVILVIAWMIGNAFYTVSIGRKLRLERLAHQKTLSRLEHCECDPMQTSRPESPKETGRAKKPFPNFLRGLRKKSNKPQTTIPSP